jgi:metal-responsive CopG/Arc/MetJ family transcriptional regulator
MKMLQSFTEGKTIVQIVLSPSLLACINKLAIERGINRSALIREAIEQVYFRDQTTEGRQSPQLPCVDNQQAEDCEGTR